MRREHPEHPLRGDPPVPHQAVPAAEPQHDTTDQADDARGEQRPDREELERLVTQRPGSGVVVEHRGEDDHSHRDMDAEPRAGGRDVDHQDALAGSRAQPEPPRVVS